VAPTAFLSLAMTSAAQDFSQLEANRIARARALEQQAAPPPAQDPQVDKEGGVKVEGCRAQQSLVERVSENHTLRPEALRHRNSVWLSKVIEVRVSVPTGNG
jgi:hypothetical protein